MAKAGIENSTTAKRTTTKKRNTQKNTTPSVSTPSGNKTVQEVKNQLDNFDKEERMKQIFADAKKAIKGLQLTDLSKTESRTFSTYSRETLRTYLKNPKSYESQIRNLSKYLFRLCYEYRRICTFYARMICGDAFTVIPLCNPTEDVDEEAVLQNFYDTAIILQRLGMDKELVKLLITAWREDSVYGYIYDDTDQDGGTLFVHILDGDYCKISSIEDGVFHYAFNFSYFSQHKEALEYWDSEFKSKYEAYQKDSSLKWQELEASREICFKVNSDDPTMDYPPFASLFEKIIDLIDLQSIQSVKDELSIYKLLVARLKPLTGTDEPDDFEVDINTAIEYYNKLAEALPECVTSVVSPLPIDAIEFKGTDTSEDDMLSNSMSNIFKTIGGQILDNGKSGTTIFEAQIIADMEVAQATLLPQVQDWLNLFMKYKNGDDHAYIKYIQGVSPYTRSNKRKELIESAQNGMPNKLEIGVLDGISPIEFISKTILENTVLKLQDTLIPLSTSYTQSGNATTPTDGTDPISGGRPESDATDLTDEGDKSRQK